MAAVVAGEDRRREVRGSDEQVSAAERLYREKWIIAREAKEALVSDRKDDALAALDRLLALEPLCWEVRAEYFRQLRGELEELRQSVRPRAGA